MTVLLSLSPLVVVASGFALAFAAVAKDESTTLARVTAALRTAGPFVVRWRA